MALFHAIQICWVESLVSLESKFATINQGNSTLRPYDFTTSEVIVWQIVSMSKGMFKNGWYDLPGPADFWLEKFDFDGYGWVIPSMDWNAVALAKDVFETFGRRRPPTLTFIDLMDEYFSDSLSHSRKH